MLVNTTGENLDLTSNPCGQALSNRAGPVLQAECNKVGRLKAGEVAMTAGGNLSCQEVFHSHCTQYGNGQGEQVNIAIFSCIYFEISDLFFSILGVTCHYQTLFKTIRIKRLHLYCISRHWHWGPGISSQNYRKNLF